MRRIAKIQGHVVIIQGRVAIVQGWVVVVQGIYNDLYFVFISLSDNTKSSYHPHPTLPSIHLYKTILKSSTLYHPLPPSSTLYTGLTNLYGHIHLIHLPLEFLKEGVLIGASIPLFRNILTHSLSQSPLSFPLSLSYRIALLSHGSTTIFPLPSFSSSSSILFVFSTTNFHPKLFQCVCSDCAPLVYPSFSSPLPPSYDLPISPPLTYSSNIPHLSLLVYLSYYPLLSPLLPRPNLSQRRRSNRRFHFLRNILMNAVHFLCEMIESLQHY